MIILKTTNQLYHYPKKQDKFNYFHIQHDDHRSAPIRFNDTTKYKSLSLNVKYENVSAINDLPDTFLLYISNLRSFRSFVDNPQFFKKISSI